MASGSFDGTKPLSTLYTSVEWTAVSDINKNQSILTVKVYLHHWELSNRAQPVTINAAGQTQTVNAPVIDKPDSSTMYKTLIATAEFTVAHDADGSKKVDISTDYNIRVTYSGRNIEHLYANKTGIALDTIPRASDFILPSSIDAGQSLTVKINRASTGFTHDVTLTFAGQTLTVTGATASAQFALPLSWCALMPNATAGTAAVKVVTKNGSTTLGSLEKNLSIGVPASIVPTLAPIAELVSGFQSLYLQGRSRCKLTGNAAGAQGSTIKSISYAGAGYTGSGSSYTTGVLNVTGDIIFTIRVTDSRGRVAEKTLRITVIAYSPPTISQRTADRCNASGGMIPDGLYARVLATFSCAPVNGLNAVSCNVSYREAGGSWTGTTALTSGTAKIVGAGKLALDRFYQIRFSVRDTVGGTAETLIDLPTNANMAVFGLDRAGIMMYPDRAALCVGGPIYAPQGMAGNASTAAALQTARTINGTSFNGSANITTANWGTARTITIGSTGKSVNGSGNVAWSLGEIGAAAAAHRHASALLWSGSMSSGSITITNGMNYGILSIIGFVGNGSSLAEHTVATAVLNVASLPVEIADDGTWMGLTVAKSGNNITVTYRNGSGTLKYISGY